MILTEIKNYFLKVKTTTLLNLSREFNLDESILEDMLNIWIKKGKLKRVVFNSTCSTTCDGCQLGCVQQQAQNNPAPYLYHWES